VGGDSEILVLNLILMPMSKPGKIQAAATMTYVYAQKLEPSLGFCKFPFKYKNAITRKHGSADALFLFQASSSAIGML